METIYWVCAVVGCTLVALQVVLQVFGLFGDVDVDADHDMDGHFDADHAGHGDLFFGILSFKALCAFVGIFGLTGLALRGTGLSDAGRIFASAGAGFVGMVAVAWMMRSIARLQASGSVKVANAVGRTGTVYLAIPGSNGGRGKVTVEVQGRTVELSAVTAGQPIATGTMVTVVAVEGDETLRVVPATGG